MGALPRSWDSGAPLLLFPSLTWHTSTSASLVSTSVIKDSLLEKGSMKLESLKWGLLVLDIVLLTVSITLELKKRTLNK